MNQKSNIWKFMPLHGYKKIVEAIEEAAQKLQRTMNNKR